MRLVTNTNVIPHNLYYFSCIIFADLLHLRESLTSTAASAVDQAEVTNCVMIIGYKRYID